MLWPLEVPWGLGCQGPLPNTCHPQPGPAECIVLAIGGQEKAGPQIREGSRAYRSLCGWSAPNSSRVRCLENQVLVCRAIAVIVGALGLAPATCAAELLHMDTDTEGGVSGGGVGWGALGTAAWYACAGAGC